VGSTERRAGAGSSGRTDSLDVITDSAGRRSAGPAVAIIAPRRPARALALSIRRPLAYIATAPAKSTSGVIDMHRPYGGAERWDGMVGWAASAGKRREMENVAWLQIAADTARSCCALLNEKSERRAQHKGHLLLLKQT